MARPGWVQVRRGLALRGWDSPQLEYSGLKLQDTGESGILKYSPGVYFKASTRSILEASTRSILGGVKWQRRKKGSLVQFVGKVSRTSLG
jgi:hypothetical protein